MLCCLPLLSFRRWDVSLNQVDRAQVLASQPIVFIHFFIGVTTSQSIRWTPGRANVRIRYPLQWFLPGHSFLLLWQCKCSHIFSNRGSFAAAFIRLSNDIDLYYVFIFRRLWCFSAWTKLVQGNLKFLHLSLWPCCRMVWTWQDWCTTFTWCLEAMGYCPSSGSHRSIWWRCLSSLLDWLWWH